MLIAYLFDIKCKITVFYLKREENQGKLIFLQHYEKGALRTLTTNSITLPESNAAHAPS